jgi:hypothetical protein
MGRRLLYAGQRFRMQLGSAKPGIMYQWKIALWKRWNSERITKSVTIGEKMCCRANRRSPRFGVHVMRDVSWIDVTFAVQDGWEQQH